MPTVNLATTVPFFALYFQLLPYIFALGSKSDPKISCRTHYFPIVITAFSNSSFVQYTYADVIVLNQISYVRVQVYGGN